MRTMLSRMPAVLWIALVVNLVFGALYLWSQGGSTTTVRIEAEGAHFRTFVDGDLALERTLSGSAQGGIGFLLPQQNRLPGLPGPYGIDSVRVTEPATGKILFEDGFDGEPSELWINDDDYWQVDDGVFTTETSRPVTTGFQPWGDYVLEVKLRNVTEASLFVRAANADNAVEFEIGPFRALGGSTIARLENGVEVGKLAGLRLETSRVETVKSIVAMLLRPYPILLLLLGATVVVALVARLVPLEQRLQQAAALIPSGPLVIGLSVGAFAWLLYLLYFVADAMPHVPDSVAYVFQAKTFASFRVTADAPSVPETFAYFSPPMLLEEGGRWFSIFPFGHPLLLAAGELVGAIWLVPPLLGATSVFLIYRVGRHIYGSSVGILAAVLLFFSPFFQMTASNFMSHNTAVFALLMCLFLLVRPSGRRLPSMFFAGVFLGLLFNIRPLAAVAFMPVLGALMVYELLRSQSGRAKRWQEILAFSGGAVLLLLIYVLYNQLTTGDYLTSAYALGNTYSIDTFGFGGRHSIALGLKNEQELLSLLLLVANGWPLAFGLGIAMLPFILGTRQRWDYVFGASAISLAGASMFFHMAAVMHGPRLWYEVMPFLMLLTARGVQRLAVVGSSLAGQLADRFWKTASAPSPVVAALAVYCLIAGLVAFSAYGWMFGQRDAWSGSGITNFTPATASRLEGFNFTDNRLANLAREQELDEALVFVEECTQWFCFGSVFWRNSPALDGGIVWAELKETNADVRLLAEYPNRSTYIADYVKKTIQPISAEDIERRIVDVASEERRDVIDAQTTTPQERDLARRNDLDRVGEALDVCAGTGGGYPDTAGELLPLTVLILSGSDCLIRQLLPDIPRDPLGDPVRDGYWYHSDGSSFVLVALREDPQGEAGDCPDEIAATDDDLGRYCIQGAH